jgi:hypothetical protein
MVETFLEQILPDKNKFNILTFFLASPQRSFFVGEIEKRLKTKKLHPHLESLVRMGILKTFSKRNCKFYIVNKKNPMIPELRTLFAKNAKNYEDEMVKYIQRMPGLKLAILTGVFTGNPALECDVVLVGNLSQRSLDTFVSGAEKSAGQEINYAVFDEKEFEYRKHIFDRFAKEIFDNDHLIINKKSKK